MRRLLVTLAGILLLSLIPVAAHAQYYAFGYGTFTSSNNLTINGTPYYNTDSGWINSDGYHVGYDTNYYSGEFDCAGSNVCRNYFSFDLSDLTGTVLSASFNVDAYTVTVPGPYDLFGTSLTPAEVYSGITFTNPGYWAASASGPMVGSLLLLPGDSNTTVTIALDSAGLTWLQDNEGSGIVLGGEFLGGPVPPPVVPEPCTATLLGMGLVTLAGMARRKFGV